jgi:two-component system, NarL family, response regulator LiaR
MDKVICRTLLAEDQEITRLGIRKMLEQVPYVDVVAEAVTGSAAVRLAFEMHPQLVLMDIGMPELDGIEATRLIKESLSCKVIMITSHDCAEDIAAGLAAGADAYCLKAITYVQLESAIRTVMEGAVWLDPDIAGRLLRPLRAGAAGLSSWQHVRPENQFRLSEREQEVLGLLVEGCSNQQIASALHIGSETVKTHMRHLMEKLKVADRTQAAVKAVKEGLIPLGSRA